MGQGGGRGRGSLGGDVTGQEAGLIWCRQRRCIEEETQHTFVAFFEFVQTRPKGLMRDSTLPLFTCGRTSVWGAEEWGCQGSFTDEQSNGTMAELCCDVMCCAVLDRPPRPVTRYLAPADSLEEVLLLIKVDVARPELGVEGVHLMGSEQPSEAPPSRPPTIPNPSSYA